MVTCAKNEQKGFFDTLLSVCFYLLPITSKEKHRPQGGVCFWSASLNWWWNVKVFHLEFIIASSKGARVLYEQKTPIQLATVLICLWLSMCVVIHIHNKAETYIFEFSIFRQSGTKLTKQCSFLPPSPCFKVVDGRERRSGCFKTSPQLWGGGRWGERGENEKNIKFHGCFVTFCPRLSENMKIEIYVLKKVFLAVRKLLWTEYLSWTSSIVFDIYSLVLAVT